MDIALINSPVRGGVTDYINKLIAILPKEHVGTELIWQEDSTNAISEQTLASDCLYLQYSGYGYAKRGAPLWLLRQLQTNRPQIKTLGIFFHELYAFGPPWGSAFWLSPIQYHIARRLAELSDFWITNREASALWLRRFANDKPHAVLPVFSNVGEMPVYSSNRSMKLVIFGGSALRLATYREAGGKLFSWAKRQGMEIHDIGPAINDKIVTERLVAENTIIHGRLAETEISRLFADAMFGVVAYPTEYVAKSGVFAAYCAHGICPVLLSKQYPSADGLIQNQHYLPGIPENICASSIYADIGLKAWTWYQPHKAISHAEALTNLLREVGHVT